MPGGRSPAGGSDDEGGFRIRSVSFACATIRSGRVAAAKIACDGAFPGWVRCTPVTPGFDVEILPERTYQQGEIIVGLRIHRRIGAPRRLCLIRFDVGNASAKASITVLH